MKQFYNNFNYSRENMLVYKTNRAFSSKGFIFLLMVVLYAIYLLSLRASFSLDDSSVVRISTLSSLVIFLIELYYIKQKQGSYFTPTIIFLIAYYLFQNGQLLLISFDIDITNLIAYSLSDHTRDVAVFSGISNVIAGFAAYIMILPPSSALHHHRAWGNEKNIAGYIMFPLSISIVVAYILLYYKVIAFLSGGYFAVRAFESTIPEFIGIFDYFYFPFSLLIILYDSNRIHAKFISKLLIIWLLVIALCGNRTTGLAGILTIAYVNFFCLQASKSFKNRGSLRWILFTGAGLAIIGLSVFIAHFRINRDNETELGLIANFISETGGSVTPLYTSMEVVPNQEPFLMGTGYFYSMVGGFLPSYLDFTGTIREIVEKSRYSARWHERYFGQYTWGLGFSLNAEAYANFGWAGLVAIFFVCCLIFYFLRFNHLNFRYKNEIYLSCVLLFLWATLPRRDTYYIWNALFYAVFLIKIYLLIINKPRAYNY